MPSFYHSPRGGFDSVEVVPSCDSFESFCARLLASPAKLPMSKASYLALPKAERSKAKRVPYFIPSSMASPRCQRRLEHARTAILAILDVDAGDDARSVLESDSRLPWPHAIYHTASSTPEAPRIRVVVSLAPTAISAYPRAVATVASALGLAAVTAESQVAVQPMFVPTMFLGETESPLVAVHPHGDPLSPEEFVAAAPITAQRSPAAPNASSPHASSPHASAPQSDEFDALELLRAPVEGITPDDAAKLLDAIDPDLPRDEWVKVICAMRHQFPHDDRALDIFDAWSAKGAKYPGPEDLRREWETRKPNAANRASFTFRSLIHLAKTRYGYDPRPLRDSEVDGVRLWLTATTRTAPELQAQGPARIAAIRDLGPVHEDALLTTLAARLKALGAPASRPALRKALHKLRRQASDLMAKGATELPAWAKGWCYVASLDLFHTTVTGAERTRPALNAELSRHFCAEGESAPSELPADFLLNRVKVPTVQEPIYDPTDPSPYPRLPFKPQLVGVNTYQPDFAQSEDDPFLLLEAEALITTHLENLIAEPEYRQHVLHYLATCVQRPGRKIRHALLLQGAQGCGKTLLAHLMEAALGPSNVRMVKGSSVVGSRYNEWQEAAQLIVLEEVRIIGHNRHDVMDLLKPAITNDRISIEQKFRSLREVPNVANYLILTNHHDALPLEQDGRRYHVVESRIQTREQVAALGDDYFKTLFAFIAQHPGAVRAFFESVEVPESFPIDGPAPRTTYLARMAEVAESDLSAEIADHVLHGDNPLLCEGIVSASMLRDVCSSPDASMQHIGKILANMGFRFFKRIRVGEERHRLWVDVNISEENLEKKLTAWKEKVFVTE